MSDPRTPVPYRLVLEDGTERVALVLDESEAGLPHYRAWADGWHGYLAADTPRGAAAKVATHLERPAPGAGRGLPVAEILAPGEPSRREVMEAARVAERERMPLLRGTAIGPAVRQPDGTYRVELRLDPPLHPAAFAAGAEAMRAQMNDALTSEDLLDAAAVVRRLPLPTPPSPQETPDR